MSATPPAISPLRQRMIDDMRMRKLADKTQSHYPTRKHVAAKVRALIDFLGQRFGDAGHFS